MDKEKLENKLESSKLIIGDVEKTHADCSELLDYINYSPKIKVEQGIPKFISWYKSYYNK